MPMAVPTMPDSARGVSKTRVSPNLAASPSVGDCFSTQWFRYAFKRAETSDDQASINAVAAAFKKTNSIVDAMVGVVLSRSFRYRSPASGEMLQ